jgi:hypothetical protein
MVKITGHVQPAPAGAERSAVIMGVRLMLLAIGIKKLYIHADL